MLARLGFGRNVNYPTFPAMPHRIAILIFPGFQILDATGPASAFDIASRYVPGAYAMRLIALQAGPIISTCGVALTADGLTSTPDTLVIAGGSGVRQAAEDRRILAYVRRVAGKSRRVVSVCSGAFVLAAAGLLDGMRATTHWSVGSELQQRFPKVRVEPDCLFIRQDRIWTSAGITAGIDLSLALIGEDLGEAVARRTAQQLVVYYRRPGGQSQFSALLELGGSGRFDALLGWARERLHEPLSVERLAEHAAMSPRTFARAFAAATGATPARAIERLRVEAARPQIEAGETVDAVAAAVGFGNAERMRRAFVRAFGQPPQALRRLREH